MDIRYDVLHSIEDFEQVRGAWENLLLRTDAKSPYLCQDWILAWWEAFGSSGKFRLALVSRGGDLTGTAPMMISRRTLSGCPVRALHPLGLNLGFLQFPVADGDEVSHRVLLEGMLGMPGIDMVVLKGVSRDGPRAHFLNGELKRLGVRHATRVEREAFLSTSNGVDAYRAERSSRLWRNVRHRQRRLRSCGVVEVERRTSLERDAPLWTEIFGVSLRSWKARAGTAVGLKPRYQEFLRALMARRGAVDAAEVWLLRLDGAAIAYRLGFRDGPTFLECEIAYDERFAPYSPGTLLASESNERLVTEGIGEINLGMGFPWKEEWSPQYRSMLELVLFVPRNHYAAAVATVQAVREACRRSLGRLASKAARL